MGLDNDKLMEAAKVFMLSYFDCFDEERQPSNFDEDILGGIKINIFGVPDWNDTIFYEALGELVKEGLVAFEQRDEEYYYWKVKELTTTNGLQLDNH